MFTARLGPLSKPARFLSKQLPPWNFITVHYAYFIFTNLLFAVVFWGSSTRAPHQAAGTDREWIGFTDCLFLCISAMTEAGLNTVNLSELNTFQQFILFLLIFIGGAIWVSIFVVQARRIAFERRFKEVIEEQRRKKEERRGRTTSRSRTLTFVKSLSGGRARRDSNETTLPEDGRPFSERRHDPERDYSNDQRSLPPVDLRLVLTRDSTPPARRGGPEMNGIDSRTGEAMKSDDEDAEDNSALPASSQSPRAVVFTPNTRFERSGPETAYDGTPGAVRKDRSQVRKRRHRGLFLSMQGVGARPAPALHDLPALEAQPSFTRQEAERISGHSLGQLNDIAAYFDSVSGWVSRNSQFHGLTQEERERLGGYEYRAVCYLSWLIPAYFVLWQLFGCIGIGAYVAYNRPGLALTNGLNPWWVGAFMAVSAFNNSGMSLLDANMTVFQNSFYTLITMSLLILAGNTCFPVFLRLSVWTMWKVARWFADRDDVDEEWHEHATTLRFLLDHPRRCYTHLFPSQHTWWLLCSVVSLNGIDWAMFEILNIGNKQLHLPTNIRVIDGLFQAFAVRSGGFYVVAISTLRIALQVLYVIMMYISVYPVVITMRNSNVYEERSLGLYAEDLPAAADDSDTVKSNDGSSQNDRNRGMLHRAKTIRDHLIAGGATQHSEGNRSFVRHQLHAQLAHDIWWIVLAIYLIMIVETDHFNANPAVWSVFNYIFEVVSGYGCVGISVGVPYAAYSFCGSWHKLSKLILCAVMLRGRHRGLPVAIDRAVQLPGEEVRTGRAEEEDGRLRMGRTLSLQRRADV